MSNSILRLSGLHWLRLTALWMSFVFLVAGIGEGFSAGTVMPQRSTDKKPLNPVLASSAPSLAAGAVTIDRITAFDFNRQASEGFADAELDQAHAH